MPRGTTSFPRVGSGPRTALATAIAVALAGLVSSHAGDILRGGARAGGRSGGSAPLSANPAVVDQARANAQDALARTTQTVQAMQAMQRAARDLAQRRPVPLVMDGLGAGGLQVAPGAVANSALWRGAALPQQTTKGGRVNVVVKQNEPQAVLNWESFNVGKKTTLRFDQSAGGKDQRKWIAVNKVEDPTGVPSQILGSIEAPGQVYVINRNGVIFGGSSQINVSTLVASSLPINDNLLSRGLLNNPDAQFLFSALPLPAGSKGTAAFNPTITDPAFRADTGPYTLREQVAVGSGNVPLREIELTVTAADGTRTKLIAGTDYTLAIATGTRRATATFTPAGLTKAGTDGIVATYTPVVVKPGDVIVQPGARIVSPVNAEGNGGRVMLVGGNVQNAGTISVPAGQAILAAGLQVGVDAHQSSDPSLRGLDVYVGRVTVPPAEPDPAAPDAPLPPTPLVSTGTSTNRGLIEAPRGSVTMIGKTVQQASVIESSTSTALNGRIDLLADYGATTNPSYNPLDPSLGLPFLNRSTGTVELGPGSLTRILPEYAGTDRAVGTKLALPSQINIEGQAIHFAGDSQILAPNANITVNAGRWVTIGELTALRFTGGQIYFDAGATIDVAGSLDVSAPISENILSLQLRGAELAGAPLQRDGTLRGPTLNLDARVSGVWNGMAWVGTPLADVSGYLGIIQRGVGQLTTAGGTVNLNAGESVIMQRGSKVDVSGGWINYEGGLVQTTRVLSQGQLVDLANATPDRVYDGLYTGTSTFTHAKYGLSETFTHALALTNEHYEQGYLQGADAGSISIKAPSMALDGTLLGRVAQGPRQQNATTAALASAGSLSLSFQGQKNDGATKPPYAAYSPTPPEILFDALRILPAPGAFAVAADGIAESLEDDRKKAVILSPELLTENGFGNLIVDNGDGGITVPQGVELAAPPRGSITFRAARLEIAGRVVAPGGNLNFTVFDVSPFLVAELKADTANQNKQTPPPDPNRGIFSLAPSGFLSTAGLVADNRPGAWGVPANVPVIDGGSIAINAYSANLAEGSVVDVSGGVAVNVSGKRMYGAGGSIAINAGREPNPDLSWLLGGQLDLRATLKGYSDTRGGSLTVQASLVQIGGPLPGAITTAAGEPGYRIGETEVARGELLHLTSEFFSQGGFSSYTVNGIGKASPDGFLPALTLAPGTVLRPVAKSWLAVPGGADGSLALRPFLKPEALRTPVSLAFGATGAKSDFTGLTTIRGDLVLGAGAHIQTDPRASVALKGDTVAVLGSIVAPAGSITVTGANSFPTLSSGGQTLPLPTVVLASGSVLSTAGRVLLTPDVYGCRIGAVLPGGTIFVSGNLVAEAGAVLDVSGASGVLDLPPASLTANLSRLGEQRTPFNSGLNAPLSALETVPTRVDSDAGAITLRGGQELFTDATLRGFAGGPSAKGGSLTISSGRFTAPGALATAPNDITLVVQQSGSTLPARYPRGAATLGQLVPLTDGTANLGRGHFAVDAFAAGGFDALKLSGIGGDGTGAVQFSGDVSIHARRTLSVADGGVLYADAAVHLEAPYVTLGTPFQAPLLSTEAANLSFPGPLYLPPTFGSGSLTVRASLIDVGNLSLQNISRASFVADDIRGNGTLNVAGALTLRAGQIYPTTASQFTIAVYDPNVVVAVSSTGSTAVTLASPVLPPGFGVGSPLLGSTVAAISGNTVTLAANANQTIAAGTAVTFAPGAGSVTIAGSGARALPLSAGGTLSVYASQITQGGTLRAPLGTINLGWDGTGTSPTDYLTGAGIVPGRSVAVTQQLTLARGSVTSVSAVDPRTGEGLLIPYGFNGNGVSWIDPTGADITSGGAPTKTVNLFGVKVSAQGGSLVDVRGGGDLFASRWVIGNGGNLDLLGSPSGPWSASANYTAGQLVSYQGATWSARRANNGVTPSTSQDWTLVPQSFAVLPGYESNYAPYAAFNNRTDALNLASADPGYVNASLSVGDRVYLGASSGLSAGTYTLLPARYALLPGAVLVTPQTGAPIGTFLQPEGASFVSGYRYNDLRAGQLAPAQTTRFEVAPASVLQGRAQYDGFLANTFLRESAVRLGTTMPRLPVDSGRVAFSGLTGLQLDGAIAGQSIAGGHGAQIDISTQADIWITGRNGQAPSGAVVLNAARLSSFGAESLLIGGLRQTAANGTTIIVKTGNITVDNAGTPLTGAEIILAAKTGLTLAPGAEIVQSGSTGGGTTPLLMGDAANAGSGNGVLLRVSDVQVPIVRAGITSQAAQAALPLPPVLTVGAGARLSGRALTLDSTYGTSLDSSARLSGESLALNSGQISLAFDEIFFDDPDGQVPLIAGLMLSGQALHRLEAAQSLSLLSYSSIDLYGTGTFAAQGGLALHAAEIRGFANGGKDVTFSASRITLDNRAGGTDDGVGGALAGGLIFDTGVLRLGAGAVRIDQFATVDLRTTGGVLATAGGSLTTPGDLRITAPVLTGTKAVNYAITATGSFDLVAGGSGGVRGGLGATLSLTGASLTANTDIVLPSGSITLRATSGDVQIGNLHAARIDVGGTAQTFYDLTRYTSGGVINIVADAGSVRLAAEGQLDVAAEHGGDAGSVSVSAANGSFVAEGTLAGRGGLGGRNGSFALDVQSLPSVTPVDLILNEASFDELRTIRVRSGDVLVDGLAAAHTYRLAADQGSITVTGNGRIDASGATGGEITLSAFGSVTLQAGARLSVAAQDFNSAGKGGAVSLESGSQRNGVVGSGFVDVQSGSIIDLSVASVVGADAAETTAKTAAAASLGNFTGKLHLRAPQTAPGTDLLVNPINGQILGASSILVEGYRLFDLTNTTGVITNTGSINAAGGLLATGTNVQGSINANAQNFLGTAGSTTAGYTAMFNRLLGADAQGLGSVLVLAPGAEVIHRTGNLTLGATNSTTTSDWNLSTFRYGAKSAAGVLTLRAAGNLVFFNALSDGFTPTLASSNAAWLYQAELTAQNALLPVNTQSWSFRLTSGADLSSSNFRGIRSLLQLGDVGSLQLGKVVTANNGNVVVTGGANALTSAALAQRYQVIRTGSGDIEISAGRDVQLLNQFATIYTAGTRVTDPTLGGNFQVPPSVLIGQQGGLGAVQQTPTYQAQYSLAGGNVVIAAQRDIKHQTQRGGVLVADSQRQIPNNWLYRRGYVDPATGEFGITRDGDIGSTTWWVDFSNFFEGVGTLGGGNVTLSAGNDVSNVDAVAATNGRVTYRTTSGDRLASHQTLVELGGGDVTVRAGGNIDAGIYYVERGRGTLSAGQSIITNDTRSASLGTLNTTPEINPSPAQWLPTTLFLGKGGFDVSAGRDLLLGPVVNPFLLPDGVNNSFWRKSYFSTYAANSEVNVTSLGGSITLRESATPPGLNDDTPILQNWMQAVHVLTTNPRSVSLLQPWLRLNETDVKGFGTVFTLLPGTLRATAFSGDINVVGKLNLAPSPTGTVELAAAGSLNGLQTTGLTKPPGSTSDVFLPIWGTATINLSDANPAAIPGITSPYAYQVRAGTNAANARQTGAALLRFIDDLFVETGSTQGTAAILQNQQTLHGTSLLHANDAEPIRIYTGRGSISGLTLFSSKSARIVAGGDLTDIAFYLQNTGATDVSVVSSGGDIVAYNASSPLRTAALAPGNLLNLGEVPLAGDIQISGPGTLEILAGGNLDLGTGPNLADGTGVGVTSIGNARNPNLPFGGADIVAAAGIGPASGLAASQLDFDAFLTQVINGEDGDRYLSELAEANPALATGTTLPNLETLDPEARAKVALDLFYLVLRDAGRDHNVEGSPGFGNYDAGFAAIATLFGGADTTGDITTRSRDIRTRSGGSISLLAPGGSLELAQSIIGAPLAPPGIITEAGGNISILTHGGVDLGISRIFTLRGGNEIIWSSTGDIAAGSSPKTVQSAPPTRVLIDPQTASVQTDLAGLATGGGIGVLDTVGGIEPGSVDLIAPAGVIDAGDAGIRATGDLNVAAVTVLNADNIQVAGTTAGTPAPAPVAAPNLSNLANVNNAAGAVAATTREVTSRPPTSSETLKDEDDSIFTVEVLGYGGGE